MSNVIVLSREGVSDMLFQVIQNNQLPMKWVLRLMAADSDKKLKKVIKRIDKKLEKKKWTK